MFSEIIYCFLVFNGLYIICLCVFFLFCKIGRITVKKRRIIAVMLPSKAFLPAF